MFRSVLTVVFGMLICGAVAVADDDPVKKKWDAAKAAYEAEMEKFGKATSDWFDKREAAARKDGNKKLVDQIKAERQAFQEKGELPKAAPVTLRQHTIAARSALENAYGVAVKEYTRTKKDVEATAVEKELEAFKRSGSITVGGTFTPLFNGKDLTGWQTHPKDESRWAVEDGVLVGRGSTGYLFTDRGRYRNFTLRTEILVGEGENGGVFFRCPNGGGKPGYEVDLNSPSRGPTETGTVLVYPKDAKGHAAVEVKKATHKAGEWFTLEITARSNRITVKVNGDTVSDYTDRARHFSEGHVALQHYVAGKEIKFRKIEILEHDGK